VTAAQGAQLITRWCLGVNVLTAVLWLTLAPAHAQTLGQGVDDGLPLWRIIVALGVCLALAVAVPVALKYRYGSSWRALLAFPVRKRRLKVIESLRVSHQVSLCIVECDGEQVLVAIMPTGVRTLKILEPVQSGVGSG
jgi:hypothetical protein